MFAQIKKRENVGRVFYLDEGYIHLIFNTHRITGEKKSAIKSFRIFLCVLTHIEIRIVKPFFAESNLM